MQGGRSFRRPVAAGAGVLDGDLLLAAVAALPAAQLEAVAQGAGLGRAQLRCVLEGVWAAGVLF